ncbi:MAG: undecaprenyl-diphosphatase [Clostridia bacterium]|nr:undecaprenyl-diphosphatase [Clostridia bacterium]
MWLRRWGHWLYERERHIFCYVNQRLQCSLLDRAMPWFTFLGSAAFVIILSLTMVIMGREQTRWAGCQALFTLLGSHLVVHYSKGWIRRHRPYLTLPGTRYLAKPWQDFSFPSGHTAASFSLAVVFALNFPGFTLPLITAAGLTGFSRLYVGMHYPSDVLGGATVGILFAYTVHFLTI